MGDEDCEKQPNHRDSIEDRVEEVGLPSDVLFHTLERVRELGRPRDMPGEDGVGGCGILGVRKYARGFGQREVEASCDLSSCRPTASASAFAKVVRTNAATISVCSRGTCARSFCSTCNRQR